MEGFITMNNLITDAVIVGTGPAGMNAALYLKRAGIKFLIIGKIWESQVAKTGILENYLGFATGQGSQLVSIFKKQLDNFDIKIINELVKEIQILDADGFLVITETKIIHTKTVLFATGASYKKLNIPGENLPEVSNCVTCDGFLYQNETVAIIGGGNSALDSALYLNKLNINCYIINKNNYFKSVDYNLFNKCMDKKIKILYNCLTKEIIGEHNIEKISYEDENKKLLTLDCKAVFINIGTSPAVQPLKKYFSNYLNDYNELIIDSKNQVMKGFFACGDVCAGILKQVSIAIGEGAKAAIYLSDYIVKEL